jgi:hypothetical protein
MGKRSPGFERRPRDFYPTPLAAVRPLIPFLRGVRTFAEPCCGEGDLVRHLESLGLRCVYQGDIATGQDALATASYGEPDAIITNPPFSRDLMHRLIAHFQRSAPTTWLLLELDWASTKQAAPFLPSCSDIVAIGRVKWIEGSKHVGMDNFGWFRFDARHDSGPVFHWLERPALRQRIDSCAQCGAIHRPQRSDSRFCSNACRQAAYRQRLTVT